MVFCYRWRPRVCRIQPHLLHEFNTFDTETYYNLANSEGHESSVDPVSYDSLVQVSHISCSIVLDIYS